MAIPNAQYMTEDEYLAFERESDIKHEYLNGQVYAMTGVSENHNLIVLNIGAFLHQQLRKRPDCKAYPSDMRVKVAAMQAYPDLSVLCGEARFDEDETTDTLLNPQVIIEVLSPTTEQYDRGVKFQHYRALDSLREYLLVAQNTPRIEHYLRGEDDQWILTDTVELQATLSLPSIGCELALSDVYEKVTLER